MRMNTKRIGVRSSSSKSIEFTTMQVTRYLRQTSPRILSSWRKEQADSTIRVCRQRCCFFINEADGECCMEHELSTILKKKSAHTTWHAGTFLLSCFSISFWQLPQLHKLHLIFSGSLGKHLSICHFWGLLACLPPASGRLLASLRRL